MTRTLPGELDRGERSDVVRAVPDAWRAHVAVLDAQGRILEVNGAWPHFGLQNVGETMLAHENPRARSMLLDDGRCSR